MAALMIDDGGVLQCIEPAKDGIVTQLYPLNQSEVHVHARPWRVANIRLRDRLS